MLPLLLACSPLRPGDYLGEALVEVEGDILQDAPLSLEGDAVAAIIWAPSRDEPGPGGQGPGGDGGPGDADVPVTQQGVMVEVDFPSRYTLRAFSGAPDEAMQSGLGDEGSIATGTLVLYDDRNGDGALDWGEDRLIGAADALFIRWSDEGYLLRQGECGDFDEVDLTELPIHVAEDACELLFEPRCDAEGSWGSICEKPEEN